MVFEKNISTIQSIIEPRGVCDSCSYNSGSYALEIEPMKIKESGFSTRYNTMRNVEKEGKGCPA